INGRLRERIEPACGQNGIQVFYPDRKLCTDNAAMVAGLGLQLYRKGRRSAFDLSAQSNLGMG
ncbi:MAG: tRNA (adenosine(37)-N6)-threonylcarbamoyltransferase complex transferase subunit TsaD, partial [Candidatus Omnitrophica bacterium]|nr:tRNA (adenosine(37)-N6)-threonylcarbamoyltransferase complex transferase subunit TsaD [Candidatus Omnitrophota bacterium]